MSRLLAGLSEDQIVQVASFAVMHGVICQVDGPATTQRIVLPLQLEIFQAMLLKRLQSQEAISHVRIFPWSPFQGSNLVEFWCT
jgi:hypothetical protein